MDADQAAVWAAMNDIYAGFEAGDVERIDANIHPEATIWDSAEPGLVRGRAERDALRARRPSGPDQPAVVALEASEPVIDVWGDTALLRHLLTVRFADGHETVRNTSVWRRSEGRWLAVHNHEDVLHA